MNGTGVEDRFKIINKDIEDEVMQKIYGRC